MSIKEIRAIFCSPRSTINPSSDGYLNAIAGVRYPRGTPRLLCLAYAFLRGKSYRVTEPTAQILTESLGMWAKPFISNLVLLINHTQREDCTAIPVTKEAIEVWMAEPEPEAHLTRRLAAEEKSRQARAIRGVELQQARLKVA